MTDTSHDDAASGESSAQKSSPQKSSGEKWFDPSWTKVHPLSPLVRGGLAVIAIPVAVFGYNWDMLTELWSLLRSGDLVEEVQRNPQNFVLGGGALLLVILLIFGGFLLSWWFTRYKLTADYVMVKSGIFVRQHRQARVDRVQAVDLRQPLLARLTGLAELKFEVAEGDGTAATLAFLKKSEAEKLRADIMERAAGRGPSVQRPGGGAGLAQSAGSDDGAYAASEPSAAPGQAPYGAPGDTAVYGVAPDAAGTPSGAETSPDAPTPDAPTPDTPTPDTVTTPAPEPVGGREIVRVPLGRLIGSVACGWGTIAVLALLLIGVLSLAVGLIVGYFAGDDLASTMGAVSTVIGAISLPALIPAGIGILTVYYSQLSSGFGFTATMTSVGLRIRYGLLETTSQTVPPGRVQALLIQQPILWRPFKWHRVLVVVAGYGAGEKRSLLLPVGTFEETMRITAEMFPDLAVDHPEEVFAEGLRGTGTEGGFTQGPRSARYFDPLARRRRGYLTTPSTLMFRDGRLNRQLTMVPHERIQSLSLDQGPLQRRAKLADIHVHSPAGPFRARLKNQSLDAVTWLFNAEAEQAAVARRLSNRHQWMTAQELQEFEKSITQSDAEDDPDSPRAPAGEGSVSG